MLVGYKRYLSFLVNSLSGDYKNLQWVEDDLLFTFEQYALSQMHSTILCHHYKRDLYKLRDVVLWIRSGYKISCPLPSLHLVLSWYYLDLSRFLRNIALTGHFLNVSIGLQVSLDLESITVSLDTETSRVLDSIHSTDLKSLMGYEGYLDLNYTELRNFNQFFPEPYTELLMGRFVSSVILHKFSAENLGKIIKMGGVVQCS